MNVHSVQEVAREFLIALAKNTGPAFDQNAWFESNDVAKEMRRPVYRLLLRSRLMDADVDETFSDFMIRNIEITVAGLHQVEAWPAPTGGDTLNINDSQIAIGSENIQRKEAP